MKLLPLVSLVSLLTSLSLATAIPRPFDSALSSSNSQLDKREPEPALAAIEDAHEQDLEKRGGGGGGSDVNVIVDVKVKVKPGRPSYDFEPDGSGYGYAVDYRGYSRPSWCPSDWIYFGRTIGWAPYKGWRPRRVWQPPVVFVRVWVKVSWWSPPSDWRSYWYGRYHRDWYRYGVPTHWGGWRPRNYGGSGGWQHEQSHGGWWWHRGGGGGGHFKREGDEAEEVEAA